MKPTTFALMAKDRARHIKLFRFLAASLEEKGFVLDGKNPQLVIVVGGDGSLLNAMRERDFQGDYLLLNAGHLGFFSDYDEKDAKKMLADLQTKEPIREKLSLLELSDQEKRIPFVSDIALQSKRTMLLSVNVNGERLTSVRANGIVVGGRTGSSGYLLSLGAPILLTDDVYLYKFIAPVYNRLFPNPITSAVLGKDDNLEIVLESGEADLMVDGIDYGTISTPKERLEVRLSKKHVSLLHFALVSQTDRIRGSIEGGNQ